MSEPQSPATQSPATESPATESPAAASPASWTHRLGQALDRLVPPGQRLPDRQPAYVASWLYVFGVATLAAFAFLVLSGLVLAAGGAQWWHRSALGHFLNSVHLWSAEVFFACMVIHLWGKFVMAAWRGRRGLTWVTGAVTFVASIGTAFTGYLSQTNFDSQWISAQAKDGLNAVGVGAFFNVLDPGQMLLWHVVLLPLVVGLLVVWHVVLVRRHGVVPPIDAVPPEAASDTPADARELTTPSRPRELAGVPRVAQGRPR